MHHPFLTNRVKKTNSLASVAAASAVFLFCAAGYAGDGAAVFAEAKSVGQDILSGLLWVSGLAAIVGFIMAGHAFTAGDVDKGKTMLKSTVIGTICIFGAVGLVNFIQSKFTDFTY